MMAPPANYRGLYLEWNGGADQLFFDCTTQDDVDSTLAVTEHPVEAGPNITENARLELKQFRYQVFVSNTPLEDLNGYGGSVTNTKLVLPAQTQAVNANPAGLLVGAIGNLFADTPSYNIRSLTFADNFDAVADTLILLQSLQSDVQVLKLITTKYSFENVLLTRIRMSRSAKDGTGAMFDLEFKELRQVSLAFVDNPLPTQPRGTPPKNKGSKAVTKKAIKPQSVARATATDAVAAIKAKVAEITAAMGK
jgi:hypothetical protein